MDDGVVGTGIGGTGGTRRPGDDEFVRFVTPGMYAIWIMFDALVSTVEAMEYTVCVDDRAPRPPANMDPSGFSSG
jgi:hypothetical protein